MVDVAGWVGCRPATLWGGLAVLIGVVVLVGGWGAGVTWLLHLGVHDAPMMKPLTCVLLMALGSGVWWIARDPDAGLPVAVGVLLLTALGWSSYWVPVVQSPSPPALAACGLLGVALSDIRCPHGHLGAVLALLLAALLAIGPMAVWMLTGTVSSMGFGPLPGIALHTTAGILCVVRAAILLGDFDHG